MRVITGSAKGFGLKAPKHLGLRPTPSRVKEALFSSLAERIPGTRILELFAGSGAFSIEALSRGAESATLVEKDGRAISLIEQNLHKTHLAKKARVLRTDIRQAVDWLKRDGATFDMIFADPPYLKDSKKTFSWLAWMLDSEALGSLLHAEGILMIEYFKKEQPPESPHFKITRHFQFGDTIVGIFQKV